MDYRPKIHSNNAYALRSTNGLKARAQEDRPERRRRRRSPGSKRRKEDERLQTNFRTTLAKTPPPLPPSLLRAITTREVPALGKVRIILRETPVGLLHLNESQLLIFDKKRKQVTFQEPRPVSVDPHLGVSAPKIFAFDQVFSKEDEQKSVVNAAVPDILQAVLAGHDGCIMSFGACDTGKTYTMVGSHAPPNQLGVIPSAISWLYRTISELKNTSGTRFSVRVSAVTVDPSGKLLTDVLSAHSQDNETSPGALLRDVNNGVVSSFAELRASTPETAARYFDLALSARAHQRIHPSGVYLPSSTLLYSLHVYQYSVEKSGKGGVVGGRSRLHLIDLGDMSGKVPNSISLSGLNAVLLSLFNGQKYLPHRDNKLSHLLQDTIGSLTCYATIIVNVSSMAKAMQHTLATLQLSSRIHRFRRKKFRGFSGSSSGSSEGSRRRSSGEDNSAGSSSVDFSSSEQSADTVIYLGGGGPGDSSDGEHPPVFLAHHIRHGSSGLPKLRSLEHLRPHTASPITNVCRRPASASPTPSSRSVPIERKPKPTPPPRTPSQSPSAHSGSPQLNVFFRHQPGVTPIAYGHQVPLLSSFKPNGPMRQSPSSRVQINYNVYQEPNSLVPIFQASENNSSPIVNVPRNVAQKHSFGYSQCDKTPIMKPSSETKTKSSAAVPSDEQWIDGPKISKSKVPVRDHAGETWVDGPPTAKATYGYMDDHKKNMIKKWVELQTAQVTQSPTPSSATGTCQQNTVQSGEKVEEEMITESDVDTISEPTHTSNGGQPNIIEELERKNLIPTDKGKSSSPKSSRHEDPSIEEICSQCEALAEECEELNSLLSCEEEECKRPSHHGLATVVEEPELESTLGADEPSDGVSLLNNPQTDCEDVDTIDLPCSELSICKESLGLTTIDSGIQVCQEDIMKSMCSTPCPLRETAVISDNHPLRVLSEENLACASNFTDIHSALEDSMDEKDFENHNLNSVEIPEYNQLCQRLDPSYLQRITCGQSDMNNIQKLFNAMANNQHPIGPPMPCQIPSLSHRVQQKYPICNICGLEKDCNWDSNINYNGNRLHSISIDKCIGTDELSKKCCCVHKPRPPYEPQFYCQEKEYCRPNHINPSNIDVTNANSIGFSQKLSNVPKFAENIEAARLCESGRYPYIDNTYECNTCKVPDINNDSDCDSTVSDDSEYSMQRSKLSKFLCVGIRRSKSKGSIKKGIKSDAKQKKSKDSKINLSKINDNTTSPSHQSKNLKRSPSQTTPSNFDNATSPKRTSHNVQLSMNLSIGERTHPSLPIPTEIYDSGQDSPNIQDIPTPDDKDWHKNNPKCSSTLVKLNHTTVTSNSLGTTQSLGESSGYESIPRDSECSSFSSSQESEMDDDHKKESRFNVIRRFCSTRRNQSETWESKSKSQEVKKNIRGVSGLNQPIIRTVSASEKVSMPTSWIHQCNRKSQR